MMDSARGWVLRLLAGLVLLAAQAGEGPVAFSTFLGGSNVDSIHAVATDAEGNIYVTGRTWSTNFPVREAVQPSKTRDRDSDCFVAKFDARGGLIFSTYFGGSGDDGANAIALDKLGRIYITGYSFSTDLPTTPDAMQEDYGGGTALGNGDAFLARFSNDGTALEYCSYLGGTGDEIGTAVAIDTEGNIVLAGATDSPNFLGAPVMGTRGKEDLFIAKLEAGGSRLKWARIIAGKDTEGDARLACGTDGAIYFSGSTLSTQLPVVPNSPPRTREPGESGRDGFFGILEPDGSALRYLGIFGQGSDEAIFDLAVTRTGAVIVTGVNGAYWGQTNGVFQPIPGFGPNDAFVAKLRPPNWEIEWFSYLGGSGEDYGFKLALDAAANIYVTGLTSSRDFPLKDSLGKYGGGEFDSFLTKISPDGGRILYSTFLGGSEDETGYGLAISPDNVVIIAGKTLSPNFPAGSSFYQKSIASANYTDGFLTQIEPGPVPPQLEIARSGGSVIVSWDAGVENFTLEGKRPGSDWKPAAANRVMLGGRQAAVLPARADGEFFRLKRL